MNFQPKISKTRSAIYFTRLFSIFLLFLSGQLFAETAEPSLDSKEDAQQSCEQLGELSQVKNAKENLSFFCKNMVVLSPCRSRSGTPIGHFEKSSRDTRGKRILAIGTIHGDEPLALELTMKWIHRLSQLEQNRSTWRLLPILNPDGLRKNTRTNAKGVDLNRNFPTKDWDSDAMKFWQSNAKSDARRFPGASAGSEPETQCLIEHVKDFNPDFIISVHTPYRVLDFDGPKIKFPTYSELPWKALGNFPGSLGRYLWKDRSLPVLTIELGSEMVDSEKLQDLLGTFAIEASKSTSNRQAVSKNL